MSLSRAAIERVVTAHAWPWLTTELVFARLRVPRRARTSGAARMVVEVFRDAGFTELVRAEVRGRTERRYMRRVSDGAPSSTSVADGHALSGARARVGELLEARRSEASTLLLVRALEHAADCGDPDCQECEAIRDRLEEPEMWSLRQTLRLIERLEEVERAAQELVDALEDDSARRADRARRSVETLRRALECA